LTSSLLPAFDRPGQASSLFIDYVTLALAAHVAQTYGDMRPAKQVRGGLASWQERRVKEIMNANLDGEISIGDLANECGAARSGDRLACRRTAG
jgi:AraC family transcriptional regulator